jgi:hypothetical protein
MLGPLKTMLVWWRLWNLPADLRGGDICVVPSEDARYKIVKVLVAEGSVVHLRLYREPCSNSPARVDTATLTLGTITDAGGFGIGHLPLSRSTFASWKPVRIQREKVTDEELEGYQMWKEDRGGTF